MGHFVLYCIVLTIRPVYRRFQTKGALTAGSIAITAISCRVTSVRLTKCPLALWLKFNIACDEEYRQQKVRKCLPYYIHQKTGTKL